MNRLNLFIGVMVLLFVLTSCRKEFDDHYNDVGQSSIGLNVVQVMEEKENLSLFVQMIKRAELERTLGESGLYSCFAPRNEAVEAFLQTNGATVESLPMQTLIRYINYHFMTGMKFEYDFQKVFEGIKVTDKDNLMTYQSMVTYNTRQDAKNPSKYIRVFTQPYFDRYADDYKLLRGRDGADFMVEGARISVIERNIPASNGVIHVLEDELPMALRADEAMGKEPDLNILMSWFENFSGYETAGMVNGVVDTTRTKYFNISMAEIKPWTLNIASETDTRVIIAPTDQAIRDYFDPYMNEEQLGTEYKDFPRNMLISILKTLISTTSYCWGIGDIDRNNPYFTTSLGTVLPLENDIKGTFAGSVFSSNAIIYKVNKMPVIPMLQSIEGGFYINRKRYGEWYKMLTNGHLSLYNLTDDYSYQHSPRTVLIQPDSEWDKKVDDYKAEYLDTLGFRLNAGILNLNVKDGKFQNRYYAGTYGYLLYKDGVFKDFKGNEARLLSETPAWTKETGNVYEIDGIFEALMAQDTNELMYRNFIKEKPDYSNFEKLCQVAGIDLDQRYVVYTVFAPTNEALERAGYTIERIENMEEDEVKKLVANHLVGNRRIFTDGTTQGGIQSNGLVLNISGSWENFSISTQNGGGRVLPDMCNMQASNGVFHGINGVLK